MKRVIKMALLERRLKFTIKKVSEAQKEIEELYKLGYMLNSNEIIIINTRASKYIKEINEYQNEYHQMMNV